MWFGVGYTSEKNLEEYKEPWYSKALTIIAWAGLGAYFAYRMIQYGMV